MKISKKILILSTSFIFSAVSISSSAATYTTAKNTTNSISRVVKSNNNGLLRYKYVDSSGNNVNIDTSAKNTLKSSLKKASALPSSYSLKKHSLSTSIKDQGVSGACWAFSAIKSMETNSIIKKLNKTSVNLSESHLAWFTYNPSTDKNDPLYGDGMYSTPHFWGDTPITDAYSGGGNIFSAIFTLARWSGAELESNAPFNASTLTKEEKMAQSMISKENLRYSSKLHLQNAECYDNASRSEIKRAIMNKGSLSVSIYYDDCGLETTNKTAHSYYQTQYTQKSIAKDNANHCVSIIGWDDNYSKKNFKNQPATDGAWLVANSYGTDYNDKGYFWLSYCEPSIGEIYSLDAYSAKNYDNIYQYDGAGWGALRYNDKANITGANVFTNTSKKTQSLKAVSFYTYTDNQKYTIKIYKNIKGSTPSASKLVSKLTTTGTIKRNGYYTIPIKSECKINPGEKFAVAVTYKYDASTGNQSYMPVEGESFSSYDTTYSFSAAAGQSFIYSSSLKKWIDSYKEGSNNVCIKAFTKNVKSSSNNTKKVVK